MADEQPSKDEDTATGERLDVYATLVDLAHGMRDTAHDMHTLVAQESGHSMSDAQLYVDRQVRTIDATASALLAYLRSRP